MFTPAPRDSDGLVVRIMSATELEELLGECGTKFCKETEIKQK